MKTFLVILLVLGASALDFSDDGAAVDDIERVARIIGGEKTTEDTHWPWLVSLEGKFPHISLGPLPLVQKLSSCGASVINSRWIMSAAHCFDMEHGRKPKYWTARLATLNKSPGVLDYIKHVLGTIFRKDDWILWNMDVEKIVIHPQYNKANSWDNDIALLKLKEAVPAGKEFEKIRKIVLPEQNEVSFPDPNQMCVVQGWGCSKPGGGTTSRAYQVTVPIMDRSGCTSFWRVNFNKKLCAGGGNRQKGTCPGDSGGPLMCERGDDLVQVGIVSYGVKDDNGNRPGVLTRVSYYKNWILNTVAS